MSGTSVAWFSFSRNRECVTLREENADTTHGAQVTLSLKRPIAGSSIYKMVDPTHNQAHKRVPQQLASGSVSWKILA